jgi:hypothetical protein
MYAQDTMPRYGTHALSASRRAHYASRDQVVLLRRPVGKLPNDLSFSGEQPRERSDRGDRPLQ